MNHSEPLEGKSWRNAMLASFCIALSASFLLGGYEFVRSPTNTLFKASFGKENLPTIMMFIIPFVAASVYLYARLVSWFGPRRTLFITTLGSAVIIAACQVAYEAGYEWVIAFLYLFRSAYIVLIIEQYWSFINSTLQSEQAKRLNGPILACSSLGAILAGVVGSQLTETLGTANMILGASLVTLPAAFLSDQAFRLCGEPVTDPEHQHHPKSHLGLDLFAKERVLLLLLIIILLTQVVAAVVGLTFQGVLQDVMPDADEQTTYSYQIFSLLNGLALVLQIGVAPWLLHVLRPSIVHVVIPLLHVGVCAAYMGAPGLQTATAAYVVFKVFDYSLFRAAKELLYIPLSFDARYRAKEVIDVFGYRVGKGGTATLITVAQKWVGTISEMGFAMIAVVASLLWAGIAIPLGASYRARRDKLS